jgi:hypothetical protein
MNDSERRGDIKAPADLRERFIKELDMLDMSLE